MESSASSATSGAGRRERRPDGESVDIGNGGAMRRGGKGCGCGSINQARTRPGRCLPPTRDIIKNAKEARSKENYPAPTFLLLGDLLGVPDPLGATL